ncbi:MAG: isoamylase early set domain-containing protein [Gemmatimonadales bacterium]
MEYHPLVKRVLDGELELAALPVELRAEAAEAVRLLGAVDRAPVALAADFEARVMAAVRRRAASGSGAWAWLTQPREIRMRVRPWIVGPALAAAAAAVLLLGRSLGEGGLAPAGATLPAKPESVFVKFVLYAPDAERVAVAGTFNEWSETATPLVRTPGPVAGVWTTTIALPPGQHQYAFVLDGRRWIADPAAPAVDDGFGVGRRNSVLAVTGRGERL